MTYYGDGDGAVTDLEQNRLDVMPSDTLDVPERPAAAAHERRARLPLARDRARVPGLQPRAPRDLARAQGGRAEPRDPHRAGVGDRPHEARPGRRCSATARRATRSSRAATGASRSTSARTPCSATTTTRRARAASSSSRAGSSAPTASGSKNGVRAEFELAYAGESSEKRAVTLIRAWAREVGIDIDARVYDTDKLINLEFNKEGDEARARLRHRAVVDRRRPDARVPALALHEGPDRRLERLGLRQPDLRAALPAGGARGRRRRRASTPSTSCSASRRRSCPTSSSTRPTRSAPSTRARGRTGRRSPRRAASRSPRTATTRSSRCGPASSPRPSYPGVPWALALLGALAALAVGSSFLARRREQREPIEIADAPRMMRLVAAKLGLALVTLAFVLTFNFFLFRAVGDPRDDLLRVPRMSAGAARAPDRGARARPLAARPVRHLRPQHAQRRARDQLPLEPPRHGRDRRGPAQHAHPRAAGDAAGRPARHAGWACSRRAGAAATPTTRSRAAR